MAFEGVAQEMKRFVEQFSESGFLNEGDLLVIGCSTSEIAGERIGTSGSEEIASVLFEALQQLQRETDVDLVFQCCEHLNRALVMERSTMKTKGYDEVSVIPVPKAGGSMASYAYKQMKDPVVVEEVQAEAAIDIGDTLIGMHLKKVAVPLRFDQKSIGHAHLTAARTRPRLIGGTRAVYDKTELDANCD